MKVKECPLCRSKNIKPSELHPTVQIERKECKNVDRGCKLKLYHFDDEHEADCQYNPLHCKYCNHDIDDTNIESIKTHYEFDCVNEFTIMKYSSQNTGDGETGGREFNIKFIKSNLNLINIDDQYIVLVVLKKSQGKVNFVVFSPYDKYKLSNYKIKITTPTNDVLETYIYYKKLHEFNIPLNSMQTLNNTISFTIKNMFIMNRKITKTQLGENSVFIETHVVDGEPGSAGNWTHDDFVEMQNEFKNIFKNMSNQTQ
jgi:hypothetical protein